MDGQRFFHKTPALKIEHQIYSLIISNFYNHHNYKYIEIEVLDLDKKYIGSLIYDLNILREIVSKGDYTLEELRSNAIKDNL